MTQPEWWNALHDGALAALTFEWQRGADLLPARTNSFVILDDLVAAGVAEVKRDPIFVFGIQCGQRTYFRLAHD